MACNAVIPLSGPSVDIVKNHGLALMNIFYSKFGCVATVDGVDLERGASFGPHRGATVKPEKRLAATLRPGIQVSVWKGDLTCFPADAVVNAANSTLQHFGGLALALSVAGGPQIQRDSDDYVDRYGAVSTGKAIVLDAGQLKCKKIIHAVGPQLQYSPSNQDVKRAEPLLKNVIYEILNRVKEQRLATVAIPAISSGLFNYPLASCADTIVMAVKHYSDQSFPGDHLPTEIFLVNNDEPTVKEICRACQKILAPQQPMPYSHATASPTWGATSPTWGAADPTWGAAGPTWGATSPTWGAASPTWGAADPTWGASRDAAATVEIGNVHLTLKKGHIEEQKVDVIVNTASSSGILSEGEISRAILTKAGDGMQREISRAHSTGRIKATGGHKLNCKEVYHTFCAPKAEKGAHRVLEESVADCLYRAAGRGHRSIAFPAIGTGHLGFFKEEVASMMLHAVVDFSKKRHTKMDVYFVIFPSDYNTFQAFEEQMRSYGKNKQHSKFSPATGGDRQVVHNSKAQTPQITLSGSSVESLDEAKRWYHNLFRSSHSAEIHNNFILHFGEKEHHQLSRLMKSGVTIEEFFTQGHACITVQGHSKENIIAGVLEVEAMLCDIQQEFVSEEEREIGVLFERKVSCERLTVNQQSKDFTERAASFKKSLRVLKVDKVENPALKALFDLKKQQLKCSSTQKMFQRIPAQFCEVVSRIGFQAECAPPEDPQYGEGIYFASTVEAAMRLWRQKNDKFLYFVEAEVGTGNSTHGKAGAILPPPVSSDPLHIYDSLSGPDVSVIFSTYQALPKYIITCENV